MNAGDPIWYRQTSRGGYGFQRDVPGIFIRPASIGPRVIVQLERADGIRKDVVVAASNVRPRVIDAKDPF